MKSFDTHSTANLPLLPILKKFFFQKTSNFVRIFEKFYYFSRILRQICYRLLIKIFKFRIWAARNNWQVRIKNAGGERTILLPFYKYGRKIINTSENIRWSYQ